MNIVESNFDDDSYLALSKIKMPSLKHLSFSKCAITDIGASYLSKCKLPNL